MYYVTMGAGSVISPGSPLPTFGKPLGKMKAEDWTAMVEKGIVQFGEVYLTSYF
jgi:hypothetical protein